MRDPGTNPGRFAAKYGEGGSRDESSALVFWDEWQPASNPDS